MPLDVIFTVEPRLSGPWIKWIDGIGPEFINIFLPSTPFRDNRVEFFYHSRFTGRLKDERLIHSAPSTPGHCFQFCSRVPPHLLVNRTAIVRVGKRREMGERSRGDPFLVWIVEFVEKRHH